MNKVNLDSCSEDKARIEIMKEKGFYPCGYLREYYLDRQNKYIGFCALMDFSRCTYKHKSDVEEFDCKIYNLMTKKMESDYKNGN